MAEFVECNIPRGNGRVLIGFIREDSTVEKPRKLGGTSPWAGQDYNVCRSISIAPEQATPERIARENTEAKRHGTGAKYAPDGTCYLPSRGARAREFRRLGRMDNDAGYGDWAGR